MFEVIEIGGAKVVANKKSACNHVYVVDVSGSMSRDLPKIRQHLKNTISLVAQPDDTFTVVYFSGRGQCGVVFESVPVSDLGTVQALHEAIDRYLKPTGLTCFVEPLDKAMSLDLNNGKLNNLIMMTDGYDNQSKVDDILASVGILPAKFHSIAFMEYGYYADRDLLVKMAQTANGIHVFSEGFEKYEAELNQMISGTPRVMNIEVKVNKKAKHAIYIYGNQIRISAVVNGTVSVPEDVERVHSIVPGDVLNKKLSAEHLYLILYYAVKVGNSGLAWNALEALGDVRLVRAYENAFTKQELSTFEDMVKDVVLDPSQQFLEGRDLNAVPNKNAPTVIDLLQKLADAEASVVTDSPFWSYNRIGRASVKADEEEVLPKFVPSPMSRLSMRGLVFNSSRPNVSISTQIAGTVLLPENEFGLKSVPSHITRNYTIIRDGIRNMNELPVMFKAEHAVSLEQFAHNVMDESPEYCYWVFDLTKIPVINRAMVESVNLDTFKLLVRELILDQADLKVLNTLLKQEGTTDKIKGLAEQYGEEAAKWLSTQGVRDYGYGQTGTKLADATDQYESIEVEYKVKGLSSLPAVEATLKKQADGKKINLADSLILQAYARHENRKEKEELRKNLTFSKRNNERLLARMIYSLILGKAWFGEEEVITADLEIEGQETTMTVQKVRKMISV